MRTDARQGETTQADKGANAAAAKMLLLFTEMPDLPSSGNSPEIAGQG